MTVHIESWIIRAWVAHFMDWAWKVGSWAFLIVLTINGIVMTVSPKHFGYVPRWLRMHGIFNTSYGSRGGANRYPIQPWLVRMKGVLYLLAALFIWLDFVKSRLK